MSNLEHYFENLLHHGADINGEPNKNALSKEQQEAVEECATYVIYTIFCGREDFLARNTVVKELEQDSILDKIRAEIESKREEASKKHSEDEGSLNYYFGLNDGLKDARDIIDKYIAESEEV